ncbi:MAG: hypothetical protein ABR559_10050, partial [Gemmatimonadota bacterium]
ILTVRGTAPRSLIESQMQGQGQPAPADAPTETGDPADLQSILGEDEEAPAGAEGAAEPTPVQP